MFKLLFEIFTVDIVFPPFFCIVFVTIWALLIWFPLSMFAWSCQIPTLNHLGFYWEIRFSSFYFFRDLLIQDPCFLLLSCTSNLFSVHPISLFLYVFSLFVLLLHFLYLLLHVLTISLLLLCHKFPGFLNNSSAIITNIWILKIQFGSSENVCKSFISWGSLVPVPILMLTLMLDKLGLASGWCLALSSINQYKHIIVLHIFTNRRTEELQDSQWG